MDLDARLLDRCHINKNDEGDRFVGIKADSENAMVYFPVGYQLPETDQEIRRDILHLISVLAEFTDKSDRVLAMKKFEAPQSVDFPINGLYGGDQLIIWNKTPITLKKNLFLRRAIEVVLIGQKLSENSVLLFNLMGHQCTQSTL